MLCRHGLARKTCDTDLILFCPLGPGSSVATVPTVRPMAEFFLQKIFFLLLMAEESEEMQSKTGS